MSIRSANQIRQEFIDFFVSKHGHTFVPSSPVVPLDDPTLLFTNAGMNQFKDVFLGTGTRPYRRAVNTQKCIRAGGKHNDLDDVGKDTYHHTFFEMLGNWSFGDYFKEEAIRWAWQLLTEVWGLDPTRLHATVFEGDFDNNLGADSEAAEIWAKATNIPKEHIHLGNKKDNFWEMGDTGPCGPCTEIHIDLTPDKSGKSLVNKGSDRCIEIWNNVFIQFNRNPDGTLSTLPAKHVDTGMGFERVSSVLQGKKSNYDIDLFGTLFAAIQDLTNAPAYTGRLDDMRDTAYRVVADHIRALSFSLADGATPSNEKRGYVVRSILRRAERYGRQYFGTREPFLHKLVPAVVEAMGGAFPEIRQRQSEIQRILVDEEESFLRTLDRGMRLFTDVAEKTKKSGGKVIGGHDVFDLHTTYGLFVDITRQMAEEEGLTIDMPGYQQKMEEFRDTSGKGRKKLVITALEGEIPPCNDSLKHQGMATTANFLGYVTDNKVQRAGTLKAGDTCAIVVDRTCFYAEQGGQVGDVGSATSPTGRFSIDDTQRLGDAILHVGRVESGFIEVGQEVFLQVDPEKRLPTMRHHTVTHLMNLALREVVGDKVDQKGSLVDHEKTRFDFTHDKPLTPAEISRVEDLVNEKIRANLPVTVATMPLEEAKKIPGVRAVFGEKYPDPVRVVLVGQDAVAQATATDSVEFCGGTHLARTGEAGHFHITGQEPVAKGVRRVQGVAGELASKVMRQQAELIAGLTDKLKCKADDLASRIESLLDEKKMLEDKVKKAAAGDLASAIEKMLDGAQEVGDTLFAAMELPPCPADAAREQLLRGLKIAKKPVVLVLGFREEGKAGLMAAVSDSLHAKGVEAGKLVGELAKLVGGKGGGQKNVAQAGGKEPEKLPEALAAALPWVRKILGA